MRDISWRASQDIHAISSISSLAPKPLWLLLLLFGRFALASWILPAQQLWEDSAFFKESMTGSLMFRGGKFAPFVKALQQSWAHGETIH